MVLGDRGNGRVSVMKRKEIIKLVGSALFLASMSACSLAGPVADELNPYSDGNKSAPLGERNTNSVLGGGAGGGQEAEAARHAIEVMGTYRRTLSPQPNYPVIQPAEVRLMWIPDHLNVHGDLVPAHYYYLRVLPDRPAVQDAFEIERQLHQTTSGSGGYGAPVSYGTGGGGSSTPWVYKEGK